MRHFPSISRLSRREILAGAAFCCLASLASNAMDGANEAIYHVNSYRVPCVGVAPMSCLQVRRGNEPAGEWQNFYSQIHGFDYQPGYLYRLLVRETQLPPDQVPADASSIRYDLVEILEQSADSRFAVHDIWVVARINAVSIDDIDTAHWEQQPYMEFNVTRSEYLGNDGCGAFGGEILAIDDDAIRLGPATSAVAAENCRNGVAQARLADALARVAHWRREQLWLTLLDNEGTEVLALRKVD